MRCCLLLTITYPLILKPLPVTINLMLLLNRTAGLWPTTHASSTLHSGTIPTIEKVLLSLVQTLTKFRPLLCGARLHIHTAHTNFTYKLSAFQTQRMLRWRLLLDEFDCIFLLQPRPDTDVADALSRVPTAREVGEKPDGSPASRAPMRLPLSLINLVNWKYPFYGRDPI